MRQLARLLVTLVGLVGGWLAGFEAVFRVVVRTDCCDPTRHVRDAAMYAGFGLGVIAAPVTGFLVGWLALHTLDAVLARSSTQTANSRCS